MMKRFKCLQLLLLLLLVFIPFKKSAAQEVDDIMFVEQESKINLEQSIKIALANNNKIKRALISMKIADEKIQKAWSNVYPEISGNASYTRNIELPVFFFPVNPGDPDSPLRPITVGADNNWRAGLTISQKIFDGEVFVGISAAELYDAVQEERFRATSQQVVTQTRLAYYKVLFAEAQLKMAKESLQRLLEILEVNRAKFKLGLIDEYAVLQAEVRVANQRPEVTAAEYEVQQAYRHLKMVMGIPLDYPVKITGNLTEYKILKQAAVTEANKNLKFVNQLIPFRLYADTTLTAIAKNYRGDIRVLKKRNKLQSKKVRAVKSRFLPSLSASYNLNYVAQEPDALNFFGTEFNRVRTQNFMLTLTVPIFDGFRRSANIQIAKLKKEDLEFQKRIAIREAKNEIETALEKLRKAVDTTPARKKALKKARKGYKRALARLEAGLGSQLEVVEAQFQLERAQLNYAQLVYNYLTAKARFDLAIGMVPLVDKQEPKID